jgi:hypothetical protein
MSRVVLGATFTGGRGAGDADGFGLISPPLPWGFPMKALGFNDGIIKSNTAATEQRRVSSRILNLKQSVFIARLTLLPINCY